MAHNYRLRVRGIDVPVPAENGIKITDEPVWDPDAGRDLTGRMIATLVCWKRTVEITWNDLTAKQATTILNAVGVGTSKYPFFDIEFNDVTTTDRPLDSSGHIKLNVYVSSIPRTLHSLKFLDTDSSRRIGDVTLTFIER